MLPVLLLISGLAFSAQDPAPAPVHGAGKAGRFRHSAEHTSAAPARPAAVPVASLPASDRSSSPEGSDSDPMLQHPAAPRSSRPIPDVCAAAAAPQASCAPRPGPRSRVPGASAKP